MCFQLTALSGLNREVNDCVSFYYNALLYDADNEPIAAEFNDKYTAMYVVACLASASDAKLSRNPVKLPLFLWVCGLTACGV